MSASDRLIALLLVTSPILTASDRIPDIPVPLRAEDREPVVNLQAIVNELYEQLGYGYFIAYDSAPPAPWSMEEVARFKDT